jgi:tetratricopeptide (TPR) repeat protein/tRNA A-37 threonylcarbamoyl transferase component Bud32
MQSGVISHYRIVRKLGKGGMGEVYLADDSVLGRKVAVKVLPEDSLGDDQAKKRLLREARAAATLDHPNICAIHEVGDEDGTSFIVMQYVEGQTLAERLRERPMSLKESLDVASQIASALEEAHSRGIIHRDIKPQNIILTPRGLVKVLDFGLAKILPVDPDASTEETQSLLTDAGVIIGTAPYMSPEQAKCGPVDARSDLFSLGAVLYECVTGIPAFTGSTAMEICARVIHEDPPAPSQVNGSVPSMLDQTILKLLAKSPADRYQSAADVWGDLASDAAVLSEDEMVRTQAVRKQSAGPPIRAFARVYFSSALRPRVYVVVLIGTTILILALLLRPVPLWPSGVREPPPEVKRLYDEGVGALQDGSYYKASKLFGLVVNRDPSYPLGHARLAEAWFELDYSEKAKDEILQIKQKLDLGRAEEHYLAAIEATVKGELSAALEIYKQIERASGKDERAYACMDLGRALERNDDLKSALRYFDSAAELDLRCAAAFLRGGIIHGLQGEPEKALESFRRAEGLYADTVNYEGVTEVLLQRGALLARTGKLAEARSELEQAISKTETTGNLHQQIQGLLQLSVVAYSEGKTTESKDVSARAVDLARQNGIENLLTQGLTNLGTAHFVRQEYQDAEEYFKRALQISQEFKGHRNEARANLALAKLYVEMDRDLDIAMQYLEQSLTFFEPGGYNQDVSDAYSLRARIELQRGKYDAAFRDFDDLLRRAERNNDESQLAYLHIMIGSTLSDKEMYPQALLHFDKAYELAKAVGNTLRVAYSLLYRAESLWRLGRSSEAIDALKEVFSVADTLDSDYKQVLPARAHLVIAQLRLSERLFPDAEKECRRVLELTKLSRTVLETQYTLGLAEALSDDKATGLARCEAAVHQSEKEGDPQLFCNAEMAHLQALIEQGASAKGLALAEQLEQRFRAGGQIESALRVCLLSAQAHRELGALKDCRADLTRAAELSSTLQRIWDPSVFQVYRQRPDVVSLEEQSGNSAQQ